MVLFFKVSIDLVLLVGVHEVTLQRCPAVLVVLFLDLFAGLQAPLRNTDHERAMQVLAISLKKNCRSINIPLEHECHASIADLGRLKLGITGTLECGRVWTVCTHHVMQTSTRGLETTSSLCVVVTADQTHKLRHGVTVIPRRTEGVFGDQPAGREDDKVGDGSANVVRGTGQNSEDGGVGVVERDGSNNVESAQVVLERVIVAVPGDNVEGSVILARREERVVKLAEQLPFGGLLFIVKCCDWGLEVADVGQAVGANGAQLGELVVTLVEFADVAPDGTIGEGYAVAIYYQFEFYVWRKVTLTEHREESRRSHWDAG